MIYFDNSATTRPLDEVIALVTEIMRDVFGNASSLHTLGLDAERKIKAATQTLAGTLACKPDSLLFTSGGTESVNTAIQGYMKANPRKGKHLITSAGEHPAALETVRALTASGYESTFLPLETDGCIDPDRLAAAIRPDTALISLIHVNNETGAVHDPAVIAGIRDRVNPNTAIHMDCVQSFGKLDISAVVKRCDMASISAHKIHGPKGVGALFVRPGIRIAPLLYGGGQQKELRPGTESTALISGFALAADRMAAAREQNTISSSRIRDALLAGIEGRTTYRILSPKRVSGHPQSLLSGHSVRGDGPCDGAGGIYLSAGSACSSHKKKDQSRAAGHGR
jgi:cysteine desulfurase